MSPNGAWITLLIGQLPFACRVNKRILINSPEVSGHNSINCGEEFGNIEEVADAVRRLFGNMSVLWLRPPKQDLSLPSIMLDQQVFSVQGPPGTMIVVLKDRPVRPERLSRRCLTTRPPIWPLRREQFRSSSATGERTLLSMVLTDEY